MKNLSNENVIHITKENAQYLQFRKLLEYEDIITHAYSVGLDVNFRTSKNQDKKEHELAIKSYKNLCKELKIENEPVIKPVQAHTDNVKTVVQKSDEFGLFEICSKNYEQTDGLVTNKKDLILSTTNADCILMILFDPQKKVIANIHSGWRGTLQRIIVNTIDKMANEFDCDPKDIICCICPSIRKCHFEVEQEVKEEFEKEFKDLIGKNYVEKQNTLTIKMEDIIEETTANAKWNIDTVLINKILMQDKGLISENIIDSGICSVCNSDQIHSYRVEKEKYRLETALISLK